MTHIFQTSIPEDDAVLRAVSMPVPEELFGTPELTKILTDMEETLDAQQDGVAIAAPQIGSSYRIFVVRYDRMTPLDPHETERTPDVGIFINPKIVRSSQRRLAMDEGCLSVRGLYGTTMRHDRATVRAQDATGAWFERGGGGVLAQAYQHEIDHLDGILFIDHATEITEYRKRDEDHA